MITFASLLIILGLLLDVVGIACLRSRALRKRLPHGIAFWLAGIGSFIFIVGVLLRVLTNTSST